MIVAGGCYREECLVPEWRRLFGSGGRAATALSLLSPGTELHTYAAAAWADDLRHSMAAHGVAVHVTAIEDDIGFSYFHPLSAPERRPARVGSRAPLAASGASVLRFGFVEGDARVTAGRATFDPQSGDAYLGFRANGSAAEHLAVVVNEDELLAATGAPGLPEAVASLRQIDDPEVVVVKRGVHGALVHARGSDAPVPVPPYRSERVFKIGSGDVFSAAFAHHWAEAGLDPVTAADRASRSVAHYVASRDAQLPDGEGEGLVHGEPVSGPFGMIYLAGPFFDLAQRWLVEEALDCLCALGASVFSPLHRVGTARPARELAGEDLEGLRQCAAVLALVDGNDPGTLFEVGYARSLGIPVVAFARHPRPGDLTMLVGTDCEATDDFASALYRVIWAAAGEGAR